MILPWLSALLAGLVALYFIQKRCFPYFWVDLWYLLKVAGYGVKVELARRTGRVVTVLDKFVQRAEQLRNKPFLIYEGDVYTYQDVDRRSNKVAQVFLQEAGLKKGETVAMLMSNEPAFVWVWFGLTKIGCTVAFLNYNIRSRSLLHCFNCCEAKTLIVGADLFGSLEEIFPILQDKNISVWVMGKCCTSPGVNSLEDKLENAPEDPVPAHLRAASSLKSPTLYIFTSGTTGLPKAAIITQFQAMKGAVGLWAFGATRDDIVYIPLPLYHAAASLLGVGGCIELGATFVLKRKFSASQFWNDCKKYNITVFQYIGELCRYICNQPKREGEKDHKVHMAVGNGVRSEVWKEFLDRFGNIKMCELYGATEGNICFMNVTGKIGAVGRTNFFYKLFFPFGLIKFDIQKDEPIRNTKGWCERVKKGEPGLLISRVSMKNPFFGYAGSQKLNEKKLLYDVFKKGDIYFNTGDMLVQDHEDFIYFRDRTGDTFRWKGENVATTEVSDIISTLDFIEEANVYGVTVPEHEGRAGMASIILKSDEEFNLSSLYSHVSNYLPSYAHPRFLRIQASMEITGTFKQQKLRLVEEGFNPSVISDALYFLDFSKKSYVPITKDIYDSIITCKIKL
ncbi:long-chain fatty acid transport protein 6 [Latimeria chalumnae]|uniref:long-chain fatty acid transport protein 6 n=1 Tax=Latimeria chalumnae TaxID=7897 RepID=UPI00313DC7AF